MNPQIAAGALRPHPSWEGAARPCPRVPREDSAFAPVAFEPTFEAQRGGA